MNISGVLVHARPERAQAVARELETLPGVEVHAISEEGRLVVTVEEPDARMMADRVVQVQDVPGVISAAMIYHHYEEDENTATVEQDPVPAVLRAESGNEEASK